MDRSRKSIKKEQRKVFVNGRFLSSERATLSIFDRGLSYGDGLFETMRAYNGLPFALDRHLLRLKRGLEELGIPSMQKATIENAVRKLLRMNHLDCRDAYIRITVTRGIDRGGLLPARNLKPSIIIITKPIKRRRILRWQREGISASLHQSHPPSLPHLKTLNYLPNLIAKMNAAKWGTSEGLFVEDGFITEGASSNLFIVSKGVLRTPPADSGILPGVMRETIIELAEREGVPWRESPISVDELKHSEEGFITNSVLEIVPVVSVEGYFVGDGKGGPVTRLLQKAYKNLVVTTGPTSR